MQWWHRLQSGLKALIMHIPIPLVVGAIVAAIYSVYTTWNTWVLFAIFLGATVGSNVLIRCIGIPVICWVWYQLESHIPVLQRRALLRQNPALRPYLTRQPSKYDYWT